MWYRNHLPCRRMHIKGHIFCQPSSFHALPLRHPTSVCVCLCVHACLHVCVSSHHGARTAGESRGKRFYCWRALWMAPTICCFIVRSVVCLSAKTTSSVRRTKHKKKKSAQTLSQQRSPHHRQGVNSNWFITRCKWVGLDTVLTELMAAVSPQSRLFKGDLF